MPLQPRKRIVVQVETNSRDDLSEVEYELLLGWVERWPGFLKKDAVEGIDITEVQPCARCGFAQSCKRVFGEDCHS
jgi:hypothetical protein